MGVLIPYLKLIHGGFNLAVFLLLLTQARLGMRIRKERRAGFLPDWTMIARHRRRGPLLVVLGLLGYFAGLSLVYIDDGRILKYPLHFVTGSVIACSLLATFLVSRMIKSSDSPWRTPHLILGIAILCFYVIQAFLGLGILL